METKEYTVEVIGYRPYKATITVTASHSDEALDLAYDQATSDGFNWGEGSGDVQFDEILGVTPEDEEAFEDDEDEA